MGDGLMTTLDLEENKFIGEVSGIVISDMESLKMRRQYLWNKSAGYFILSLGMRNLRGQELHIDTRMIECTLKFINHSCDPNCRTEIWMVEGLPRIGLFTNKFIERGTMLSRDYVSGAGSEAEGEKCLCGEACCNGFF